MGLSELIDTYPVSTEQVELLGRQQPPSLLTIGSMNPWFLKGLDSGPFLGYYYDLQITLFRFVKVFGFNFTEKYDFY
jgi:hypothetical protein